MNSSKTPFSIRLALLVMLAVAAGPALAQTAVLSIANDPSQLNHYPGPDGLVGTNDDVVSASNTTLQGSASNAGGSYGFNAFKFSASGPDEESLPEGFDAITFVNGAITIDKDVFAAGGGPIITALNVNSGTEPFVGHGAYTSTITAVNSGTYNPATGEFTLNVDFSYTIMGQVSTEPGVVLTGTAIYQASGDFGTDSGNSYFEDVAKPLAQSKGATGVVFLNGTGTLSNLGFPIRATIVALEGTFTINAGINDAWVNAGAPFQGLFLTVFEDLGFLFLSWFTFDSDPPAQDTATFGASDQRWVTGLGSFVGNAVTMNVELTSGGIFNGSVPEATQEAGYGTITIIFIDCNQAILTYNFPGPGLSGQMTLTRVVGDNVALCETLAQP